jgi:hypothetical protein
VVVVVVQTETEIVEGIGSDYAVKYGFSNPDEAGDYFFKSGRGISHEVVEAIAEHKNEPAWMRKVRHRALDYFFARPLPTCPRRSAIASVQKRSDERRESDGGPGDPEAGARVAPLRHGAVLNWSTSMAMRWS